MSMSVCINMLKAWLHKPSPVSCKNDQSTDVCELPQSWPILCFAGYWLASHVTVCIFYFFGNLWRFMFFSSVLISVVQFLFEVSEDSFLTFYKPVELPSYFLPFFLTNCVLKGNHGLIFLRLPDSHSWSLSWGTESAHSQVAFMMLWSHSTNMT